jgi:hypothetical protein
MDRVAAHYHKILDDRGLALSGAQLLDWADSKGLRGVSRQGVYKFLREAVPSDLGAFARAEKVKHYQTVSPLRPGVYFIDYGEFHKHWAGSNSGATGFLVAVENVTCRLFVLPTRGKDTVQWLNSIAKFVEQTRQVSTIYSDRDAVATSYAFRTFLMRDYKIRWNFLRGRNKSFLAERLIGFVKTKLSQSLLHRRRRSGNASFKRWIEFVPALVEEYNNQRVPRTRYRRKNVSRENFNDFLTQLFGGDKNFDLRFNAYSVPPFQHRPQWNKKIFKFELGQRVRVSRKADWTDPENRQGFAKASSRGAYGQKTYPIVGRQLRATKDWKRYVPVYLLGDMPDGAGYTFYEADLVASSASA